MKLGELIDIVMDNILGSILRDSGDWVLNPGFMICQLTAIIHKLIIMNLNFYYFGDVN